MENIFGSDFLSSIYFNIFSTQRMKSVCVVQLPPVFPTLSPNLAYFTHIDNLDPYKEPGKGSKWRERKVVPHYVLIPVSISNLSQHSIPVGRYLSSKLIAMDAISQSVYIGCIPCNPKSRDYDSTPFQLGGFNYKTQNTSLVHFQPHNINLNRINKFWNHLHRDLNLGRKERDSHSFIVLQRRRKLFMNCFGYESFIYVKQDKCALNIIRELYNCTSRKICNSLFDSNIYDSVKQQQKMIKNRNLRFSAVGAQYHGTKFVIFHGMKAETKSLSRITSLLYPLSMETWITFLISLIVSACILKLTNRQQNSCFWVISSCVEQGSTIHLKNSFKNFHLILIWLFATLLFRNFYTSSMYSYLTKKPEISGIPKTFEDLKDSNRYSLMSDPCVPHHLSECKGVNLLGDIVPIPNELNSFCKLYLPENMHVLSKEDSAVPYEFIWRLSMHLPSSCRTISGHGSWKCNNSLIWENFGLVYHTNFERRECGALLTPLISFSGERSVFRNNDPVMVPEPFLWSFRMRSYISSEMIEDTLSSLVDSGILNYYKFFKDSLQLSRKLKRMNFQLKRRDSRVFLTFAIAILQNKVIRSGNEPHNTLKGEVTSSSVNDLSAVWLLYELLITFAIFTFVGEKCVSLALSKPNRRSLLKS
ncbi:unnamed protein product [Orchesella dallaii]|uniref:Uncharacterized protein n=1 Tax=Orchesella dallaii TaxID=48710 RepID=A0ABP1PT23_9HEXA